MRAIFACIFALTLIGGLAGCLERPCTPGTVMVAVDFDGATDAADTLAITMNVPDSGEMTRSIARTPGSGRGTIEMGFSAGYPKLQQLSLRIVALRKGIALGDGTTSYVSGTRCDNVEIAVVGISSLDLSTADLATSDLATHDPAAPDLATADLAMVGPPPPDLAAPGPICSADHWCWSNPKPQGAGMVQAFGFAADDIWAVGDAGTILHFDGQAWRSFPGVTQADLWTVWGLTPNDVWVAGEGTIAHFDGKSWQVLLDEGADLQDTFVSIWGSATNDVYVAAGTTAVIGHWDGKSWTLNTVGDGSDTFTSIAGSGPTDIWAVGSQLWHSDGTGFVPAATQPDNTAPFPTYIYVVGPGDAWLVGARGRILHWSGGTFTPFTGVTKSTLEKVWGRGGDDIWACGTGGTVIHWNGSAWQASYTVGTTSVLWGGWSAGPNDVWFMGDRGTMLHYDGSSFSSATTGFFNDLADIWGSAANDIWVVGALGAMFHGDGQTWTPVQSGTTISLFGVWGTSASDVWAVGAAGTILHWDGTSWHAVDSGVTYDLVAVWGSRANDVWAVGEAAGADYTPTLDAPILHWNGSAWSGGYTFSAPLGAPRLSGVRNGRSAGTAIAVGSGDPTAVIQSAGVVVSYPGSGTVWNVATLDDETGAADVYSGVFSSFVASGSSVYTDSGTGWTSSFTFPNLGVSGLFGFADNDVYVVGNNYGAPMTFHWSGSQWTPEVTGADQLLKIWGTSTHDVWGVGYGGIILHKIQ